MALSHELALFYEAVRTLNQSSSADLFGYHIYCRRLSKPFLQHDEGTKFCHVRRVFSACLYSLL